ncbi:MAG: PilN domain-containing protein [Lysinibacillus sp.]
MIPDINLLPNTGRDEEGSRTGYILLGIITILLLAVMSWLYFSARADVVSLTNEEQALQAERDEVQMELDGLQGAGQGSIEESLTFIEQISYPATPLVDETQRLLPDNTYLRSYSFGQAAVMFTVDFETLNAISMYIERLEASPYFLDVQVGEITNFELGSSQQQQDAEARFSEVPRYTVEVMLAIDGAYLATGGEG